ncbi:maleylpyruvate isomerase [Cryobacterium mesophilum]|uniref:Maleylpyruvate isomerase family mycothiol-dependent enzyme n=1 Tax=Terrimesophilobacter mesophilus TaxID=433647 RepID=A0A4R8V9I1_9MICO|nr:maleylpyruvate isomerase family mycothiol-dependent enzyme [Terrimesophilobacter mesophilus]MBB5633061.1 maleylpyruvate isomerase [Terrimesophilobacter mesophilus]TFB79824.1 maleylpyruvate isomerase family mycothiol-dependent enzyme [Terrimesophilobacter mesophilus]
MKPDAYLTRDPEIRTAIELEREGAAYYDRTLDALRDDELDAPSILPGWSRRHVVSHVAFNAQALRRLVNWAATGIESRMYESTEARDAQIEDGARLPASELRALHRRSAAELDASWRDLADPAWHAQVRMTDGPLIPATSTIWLRTREVWLHAVDLDSGASYDDFPAGLVDHLLANVLSSWRGRREAENIPNFILSPTDRGIPRGVGAADDADAVVLHGSAVDLTRWATGRGFLGVLSESGEPVPVAPRWI